MSFMCTKFDRILDVDEGIRFQTPSPLPNGAKKREGVDEKRQTFNNPPAINCFHAEAVFDYENGYQAKEIWEPNPNYEKDMKHSWQMAKFTHTNLFNHSEIFNMSDPLTANHTGKIVGASIAIVYDSTYSGTTCHTMYDFACDDVRMEFGYEGPQCGGQGDCDPHGGCLSDE